MITVAGLLIDNPGEELRTSGHQVTPAVEHGPQPCRCAKHNHDTQSHQDRGPTPLNSPDIVLGKLALGDEAFTLGKAFAFSLIACCQKRRKQRCDLGRVFLAPCDPFLGVGQFVAAQQQIVACPCPSVSCLPARGGLAQARMLADPFDIPPQ